MSYSVSGLAREYLQNKNGDLPKNMYDVRPEKKNPQRCKRQKNRYRERKDNKARKTTTESII